MAGLVCFFRDGADILHFARVTIMHVVETRTREIRRRLVREGWYLHRRGRNHDIYRRDAITETIILPRHRIVSPGVARQIAAIAGWEEYYEVSGLDRR